MGIATPRMKQHNRCMSIYESAGKDLLDRAGLIKAYTRLLDLPEGPRVFSVEAGYGEGKTVFANMWRDELDSGPHLPILFNAWEADGADDPLMAFMAGLASAIPVPEGKGDTDSRGSLFWEAGKKLFMTSARTVGRAVLREGMDELTDGIGEILKTFENDLPKGLRDEFTALANFVAAQDGDLDKALVGELSAQFAALRLRSAMRTQTLDTIHAALTSKDDGKVIVLIDELDRCRPDFAVGLLEAIKHLFNHSGFRFVLMLNPGRLESTAGQLFGLPESGERYLTKFIDQRLRLPTSSKEQEAFITHLSQSTWLGDYTSWGDVSILGDNAPLKLPAFVQEHGFSLREIAQSFENLRLTIALYPEKPIDAGFLVALALCTHRPLEGERLLDDDPTGFESRHTPFMAATSAYLPIKGLNARWAAIQAYIQWKSENSDTDTRGDDNPELDELRRFARSFGTLHEKIFGEFRSNVFDGVSLIYAPEIGETASNQWNRNSEYELQAHYAIRAFVTHHLDLLEKTTPFVAPVND